MKTKILKEITRRNFIKSTGVVLAGSMISTSTFASVLGETKSGKRRVAMVGTGSRGNSLYGKFLMKEYGDLVEFVGLCDINVGRVNYSKKKYWGKLSYIY